MWSGPGSSPPSDQRPTADLGHTRTVDGDPRARADRDPDDDTIGAVALPLPPPRPNGSILMAAMLGLANALGMERTTEPTEMAQPAEPLGDGLDLDFGSPPPLDD